MFYLNTTLNFGIPTVLVFQQEDYYKVDRLLTGLTAQQKGTTARWYSNKTSLIKIRPKNYFFIVQDLNPSHVNYLYDELFPERFFLQLKT